MNKIDRNLKFERTMKGYIKKGMEKLETDLAGTREAIKMVALEKIREFVVTMDKGLDKDEREFLCALLISSMYQSFCFGYGIGKVESETKSRIHL